MESHFPDATHSPLTAFSRPSAECALAHHISLVIRQIQSSPNRLSCIGRASNPNLTFIKALKAAFASTQETCTSSIPNTRKLWSITIHSASYTYPFPRTSESNIMPASLTTLPSDFRRPIQPKPPVPTVFPSTTTTQLARSSGWPTSCHCLNKALTIIGAREGVLTEDKPKHAKYDLGNKKIVFSSSVLLEQADAQVCQLVA